MMSSFGPHSQAAEVAVALAAHIRNRTFLITGTSAGGLGASTALALAHHAPTQLILVSRTRAKVDPVIEQIRSINPSIRVVFIPCELTDFSSVRAAAQKITDDAAISKIDVVVNNAGVMAVPEYTLDKQGFEMTLSACHLGHFLLTNVLLPKTLAAGPGARIVNVTSHGHRISPFRFDDYNFSGGASYDGWTAYGQAKTANQLFSVELSRRLARRAIRSYGVEPGSIMETNLSAHISEAERERLSATISEISQRNTGKGFEVAPRRTLSEGTACVLVAALEPGLEGRAGAYVSNCRVGEAEGFAMNAGDARRLWEVSEGCVGERFEV
jgi:NAD(P)-dependent dehydrogenase (short-subunit alcohol dehydrogenase family)